MKVALIKGQEAVTHWLRCCIGMLFDGTFYLENDRDIHCTTYLVRLCIFTTTRKVFIIGDDVNADRRDFLRSEANQEQQFVWMQYHHLGNSFCD